MSQRVARPILVAAMGMLSLIAGPAVPGYAATPSAEPSTIGVVPPNDPTYFCYPQLRHQIDSIDYCRAREGVGPMILPDNYSSLTPQEQMLVIFNLERVNRGLAPVVGLSASLDGYAQQGADKNDDPPFPPNSAGGGIWDANTTTLGADDAFMYTDDCTPTNVKNCWGHRDNILMDNDTTDPLDGGGGFTAHGYNAQLNSYTFQFIWAYSHNDFVFTWNDELTHFSSPPAIEPVQPPTITRITPGLASIAGGSAFTVHGRNLISAKAIRVDGQRATRVRCQTETTCTALAPAHAAGTVGVRLTTVDGTTPSTQRAQLTYVRPALRRVGRARRSLREGHLSKPFTLRVLVGGAPAAHMRVRFKVSEGAIFDGGGGTRTARTRSSGKATSPRLYGLYNQKRVTVTARVVDAKPLRWQVRIHR